jgi:competence protein ComEC
MSRLPPGQIWVAAAAVGLAAANGWRLHGPLAVLAAVALAGAGAVLLPLPARVAVVAAVVCVAGWGWGTVRLDTLDRSPLSADVDRSGRALLEITGEARHGAFELRIPARIHRFEGRPVSERVQLELPLGRAPPQGALVDALVVVRLPRGPSHGFDERLWLRRQGVHLVLKVDDWQVVGRRHGLGGIADRLRSWLKRDAAPGLTGERSAVIGGVVLGDDAALSYGLQNSFRRSGLYHLLAVSGQNVVLLAAGVLGLAWLAGLPRAAGHICALAAIGGYVLAVGPQPSVIRAAGARTCCSTPGSSSRSPPCWPSSCSPGRCCGCSRATRYIQSSAQRSRSRSPARLSPLRSCFSSLDGCPCSACSPMRSSSRLSGRFSVSPS